MATNHRRDVQNQDKEWLTTGIYQAKRATQSNPPIKFWNSERYRHRGEFGTCHPSWVFHALYPHRFALLNSFNSSSCVGLLLTPFHLCVLHSLITGGGDQLSLFGHRHWCLVGSLYAFKLTILTYLMVVGIVFAILPFSDPAGQLQALLLDNGSGDLLSLFGHPYWYLLGSFQAHFICLNLWY